MMITLTLIELIRKDDEYNKNELLCWVICNVL